MSYLTVCTAISFVILIQGCLGCQVITDRSIEEVLEENYNSPWLVFIIDIALGDPKTKGMVGLAYGSLIHKKLVLSAAYPLAKSEMKNLEVRTNCTSKNKEIICVTQKVSVILDSSLPKKKEKSIDDWVILVLDEPFPMNERINVIKLAYNDDEYEKTCQIYHWQIIAVFDYSKFMTVKSTGVLHYAYNVTLNGDEFELTEEGMAKLENDGDCIIEDCYSYDNELKILTKKISFTGSPIICQSLDGTPIQVGFSTAVFGVSNDEKMPNTKFQRGGFVRLLNDTDRFLKRVVNSKYL